MFSRQVAVLASFMLALGGAASAATIASAPNYGGLSIAEHGGTVTCRLFNAGGGTVQLSSVAIVTGPATVIQPYANTCLTTLGANSACEIDAQIPGNLALSCKAIFSGTGVILRGVTEVRDASGIILNDLLMQ